MRQHLISFLVLYASMAFAQTKRPLPIIDMHLHAIGAEDQGPPPLKIGAPYENFGAFDPKSSYPESFIGAMKSGEWNQNSVTSPVSDADLQKQTLAILEKYNIYAVTSGDIKKVLAYQHEMPRRIIPGIYWDLAMAKKEKLDADSLSKLFKSGAFKVFGEIAVQYQGISPSDQAVEPYLKMAESLDVPTGIHLGTGPPGNAYLTGSRAKLGSALVLEDALLKHPKLRVYAMHAGWPMLDDMLAMLYAYPELYVDLGVINYILPQKEFDYYLGRMVNAGFGKRIMYGSDQMVWPGAITVGIKRIQSASYLNEEQKRDILFNNAARFLRLSPKQIKAMY
ncbi:amidohydrolase family protein [Pedobacter vanadiisoli]|uniref:Amidohydrolase family protein n=1 Tax=Pedobacter vanadiisoli TaxID=1761975 RepID=A0ABW5ME91_9SPHI